MSIASASVCKIVDPVSYLKGFYASTRTSLQPRTSFINMHRLRWQISSHLLTTCYRRHIVVECWLTTKTIIMTRAGLSGFLLSVIWLLSSCDGSHGSSTSVSQPPSQPSAQAPNFLIVVSDDQSFAHTSFAGDTSIRTPAFDRIARDGVYFSKAYASAPSCTASRSSLLAGRHFWQTSAGATLWGSYSAELPSLQGTLQQNGYKIGYTGKGWGPGVREAGAITAGPAFNDIKLTPPEGISNIDYSANFTAFLSARPEGQPFSFLFTSFEPHRPYAKDIVSDSHIDWRGVVVPDFLPDVPAVKKDIANYLYEIEWFDQHLSSMLEELERRGELENTVVIVTSDNGMPFARAKSNDYEFGVHVPLAVQWPRSIAAGRQVTDFVNLADIAPTVLEAAGIAVPQNMTGVGFMPQLRASQSGRADAARNFAVTGFERHVWSARPNGQNYPVRALHSDDYLYIRNFEPQRWPAGNPPIYSDIDNQSPSKDYLLTTQTAEVTRLKGLATNKRPAEELYFLPLDPFQLHNVADQLEHQPMLDVLRSQLTAFLVEQNDLRVVGNGNEYDNLPYHGPMPQQ